jgi:hypothetical protein
VSCGERGLSHVLLAEQDDDEESDGINLRRWREPIRAFCLAPRFFIAENRDLAQG